MLATLNAIIGCNRRCSVRHQRASDQCVFTWLVPFRIVKEICWLAIPAFSKSSFIQFLIISNAVVFCLLAFLFSLVDCFTSFISFASYFISYLSGFLLILATIDRMSSFYSWIVPHRFGFRYCLPRFLFSCSEMESRWFQLRVSRLMCILSEWEFESQYM